MGRGRRGRQAGTLDVLLELTRTLAGELPLEAALTAVTDAAMKLLPCEHSSVRVLDEGHQALLSSARSGAGAAADVMTFRRGEGLIGWVAETGRPARVRDVRDDPRFKPGADQGFTIRSMLAVPLGTADQVVGVLGATASAPGVFGAEHELLATLLANCAVPAIERARLQRLKERLEQEAVMDPGTPAYNQRYLMPRLREEIARARRQLSPLSLLLMDLDDFKSVNDQHGHAAGDAVLRGFAETVLASVRSTDVLVRRGGDEFALVMPRAAGSRAIAVARRIRDALDRAPAATTTAEVRRTVSIGVATWNGAETAEAFEARADAAMYEAKRAGRNRVAEAAP